MPTAFLTEMAAFPVALTSLTSSPAGHARVYRAMQRRSIGKMWNPSLPVQFVIEFRISGRQHTRRGFISRFVRSSFGGIF